MVVLGFIACAIGMVATLALFVLIECVEKIRG